MHILMSGSVCAVPGEGGTGARSATDTAPAAMPFVRFTSARYASRRSPDPPLRGPRHPRAPPPSTPPLGSRSQTHLPAATLQRRKLKPRTSLKAVHHVSASIVETRCGRAGTWMCCGGRGSTTGRGMQRRVATQLRAGHKEVMTWARMHECSWDHDTCLTCLLFRASPGERPIIRSPSIPRGTL